MVSHENEILIQTKSFTEPHPPPLNPPPTQSQLILATS